MQPLRSTASTAASSLLRVAPSQCLASVLSYSRFQSFVFLPWHQGDWFPQCPIKACIRLTPPIRRTHPPRYRGCRRMVLEGANASSFDVFSRLTTHPQWFRVIRLSDSYLTLSHRFSSKLTALASKQRPLRPF